MDEGEKYEIHRLKVVNSDLAPFSIAHPRMNSGLIDRPRFNGLKACLPSSLVRFNGLRCVSPELKFRVSIASGVISQLIPFYHQIFL
jgi:hypothetical protein